ncbi:hypothetical protein CABS01_06089 [Colletotrichum abscissum]|uniref:Uncharacterized protein n=1 Tax=Colletotrichum abscissum TaxID=1671311 RepID=A0A9P9XBX3_9PEZI|nr:uncharacterized protein CABS01_06089 [Colletotrichum abscissum]KAI3546705.1 hypothetical protein CABS02_08898 [Colletotrichum abscissum]KAK1518555.1 hypothetical protein CABS01_06089 [Colletotrichum abscissum]
MLLSIFDSEHYVRLSRHATDNISGAWRINPPSSPGVVEIEEMRAIMTSVRESANGTIDDITRNLENFGNDNNWKRETISIAASLVTMMKIRLTTMPQPEPPILWTTGSSLMKVVAETFQRQSPEVINGAIDYRFTLSNLAVYYNCSILWTDRLDRHLEIELNRRTTVIMVYQHKIWLSAHSRQAENCIVPQEIICEALDTLNLLFPHNDRCTESFLRKQKQIFHHLGYCGRERKLELESYPYWGCKIKKLIEISEGKRSGIWQFVPDSKGFNLIESANFWIATAAAFLAFVGFVLGLTSIVYAKWSYDVGVKSMAISEESLELTRLQYQLSLAQACSDSNEARLLPDFCSAEE